MNRWIISTIIFLFYSEEVVLQSIRELNITGNTSDREVPVWIGDDVTIVAFSKTIWEWLFNNITVATLNPNYGNYNYPNTSPLGNINASIGPSNSEWILNNVGRVFTGNYQAFADLERNQRYSLHMTVHEVNLSAINFILNNDALSCTAYLHIDDHIDPNNSEIYRLPKASDLILSSTNLSRNNTFQITDSSLTTTTNPSMNTTITVDYTFIQNNFSTTKSRTVLLNYSTISPPDAVINGTLGNYIVVIKHVTSATCVRNITYCLITNGIDTRCNFSNTLNDIIVSYPSNSNTPMLSITYDIIYAKYQFNLIVTEQTTTTTESTTTNSSPSQGTMTQTETTTAAPTSDDSGGLERWEIALIVVGSILGFVLLLVIIFYCIYIMRKKADRKSSSEYRPGSDGHTVKSSTSSSQPRYNPRPISTIETVSTRMEPTERLQYSSLAADLDSNNRPIIPQPRYRLTEPSNLESEFSPTRLSNYSQYPQSTVSPPFDRNYPSQGFYRTRQFLSPTEEFVV